MLDPKMAIAWVRERVLQITAILDSAIAVLLGFNYISWTADQVGLVMALIGGLLNLVAYADAKTLRDTVALYEYDRDSPAPEPLPAVTNVVNLTDELLDRDVRRALVEQYVRELPDPEGELQEYIAGLKERAAAFGEDREQTGDAD